MKKETEKKGTKEKDSEKVKEESKPERKHKKSDKDIIAELTDSLQRLQAEFQNYKKRIDKEKLEFGKYSNASLILEILPILDSFELALKNTKDNEKFVKGIEMIFAQMYSMLKKEGLKPIETLGKKFDPHKHEVLLREKSDKEEDLILEELQKGYMINDKVLRPSKVKISQKK